MINRNDLYTSDLNFMHKGILDSVYYKLETSIGNLPVFFYQQLEFKLSNNFDEIFQQYFIDTLPNELFDNFIIRKIEKGIDYYAVNISIISKIQKQIQEQLL